jgi:hypothetical protein
MRDAAWLLTSKGFAVIPLRPQSKSPLTKHGCKDATRDREQISRWWSEYPDANVGVATGRISNVVVIDVDGAQGAKTLAELEKEHGELPQTLTATTARGKHFYFAYPANQTVGTSKKLGHGIDFQSDGNYCVGPPSIHPDGSVYRWTNDAGIHPLPSWVLTKLTATTAKGDRQEALKKFACDLVNKGATPGELREAVHLYNKEKCRPQKTKSQVDSLVDWVLENHSATEIKDYDLDWFQFNTRKFFGDVNLMTLKDYQMGWWIRLQAFAWANKGVLPADLNKLARLAGAEDTALFKSEVGAVLFEYELVNGQQVNAKMAAHWADAQELTKKRVKAGKARAEKARALSTPIEEEEAAA